LEEHRKECPISGTESTKKPATEDFWPVAAHHRLHAEERAAEYEEEYGWQNIPEPEPESQEPEPKPKHKPMVPKLRNKDIVDSMADDKQWRAIDEIQRAAAIAKEPVVVELPSSQQEQAQEEHKDFLRHSRW